MLIDGVDGRIVGDIYTSTLRTSETAIALGQGANAGTSSVSIGSNAGALTPANNTVSVGASAGYNTQGAYSVALGSGAGSQSQGASSVGVGGSAGATNQGIGAVAVGMLAGNNYQGANAIAIGYNAGRGTASQQAANTIILNATGSEFNGVALQTNSFYVNPIRNATGTGGIVQYDATTKEVSYSSSIAGTFTGNVFTTLIDSADSSAITITPKAIFNADVNVDNDIQLTSIQSSIRGTDKIKFVPSNADELSYNVRLDVYSESTIEPRLALDTPDGVDLTLSSGMAGIVVSKIHGRVNLAAGNNAFIVRENGSWAMTASDTAPGSPTVGVYIANGTTWDPAAKSNGRPYPVWYDGASFNALY
jgi:hypothetical protein